MSENNVKSEQELWDVLSEPVKTETKPEPAGKPASKEGRFAKPGPMKEAAPAKEGRKLDGFFFGCMAGVAAVSVAATLLLGGMLGDGKDVPGTIESAPPAVGEADDSRLAELELENAELRAQLELQKQQVKELQNDLFDLMGSEQYLATAPSVPEDGGNEVLNAQLEAYEIFAQIQAAYAEFDREKLEELIPEMDQRLNYLSPDTLNSYYLILEYVEQPVG